MSKVRVASFSVSLDGFGAGPEQSLENPMGAGGMVLHEWAFGTQTFKKMMGREGGSTGVDESVCGARIRKCGRVDSGAEYVRAGARAVAE